MITEQGEEKPATTSPGYTVLSAVTEQVSEKSASTGSKSVFDNAINSAARKVSSPGSIKTEKLPMVTEKEEFSPGSSIKTEKASVPDSAIMSVMTEKASVSNISAKINKASTKAPNKVDSTKKVCNKSKDLPPKKPITVKDFATKKRANSKSGVPVSLGIPDLTKTTKQSRAESPATPKISNSSLGRNLSFSYPDENKKSNITSVRSMSPSLERSVVSSKKLVVSTKKQKEEEKWDDPPLDNVGSAIIITDLLSDIHGVCSPKEESKSKNKILDSPKTTKAKRGENNGQEVIIHPSIADSIGRENDAAKDKPKATLLQRALSMGNRSISSMNSKHSVDEIKVIAPAASKDSSKSSKNPASDASTAASTNASSNGSISSNENKSEGNFSEAATENTRKISNGWHKTNGQTVIGKSSSFSSPNKDKSSVKTVRSMSPSLGLMNKYRVNQNKDKRETIASVAVTDKSLPPLAPKLQREIVSSKLETRDTKREADNDSVEVVNSVDTVERKDVVAAEDAETNSLESDRKRRQKIKMGKLLRSRQELRTKSSLAPSPSPSLSGPNVIDIKNDDISALESVAPQSNASDVISNTEASTIQKEYALALEPCRGEDKLESSRSEVKSLTEIVAATHVQVPGVTVNVTKQHSAADISTINEMDAYADLNDPVPISQIDFLPDQAADDAITLDHELSEKKQKYEIWHEKDDIDQPAPKGRFACGAGGLGRSIDSVDSDDFLQDDLSYDGKNKTQQPLACGADELAEEIGIEIKNTATEIFVSAKKVSMSAARTIFGACDITQDGGVEVLADEMNATQKQLLRGEIPMKSTKSKPRKIDRAAPTAQEALDEASQRHVEQKTSAYLKKRYHGASDEKELTIVERQEQIRKQREEKEIQKRKRHVLRLKLLSSKHL